MEPKQRNILRENPPTAVANDGKTTLKRYRVDAVIYARNVREARARLREVVGMQLDDGIVESPGDRRAR